MKTKLTYRDKILNTVDIMFKIWCQDNDVDRQRLKRIDLISFMTEFLIRYEKKNCIDCVKRLFLNNKSQEK